MVTRGMQVDMDGASCRVVWTLVLAIFFGYFNVKLQL